MLSEARNAFAGWVAVGLLKAGRLIPLDLLAGALGWLLQRIGPWLPEHRVGRDNLRAAFPEKSDREIEEILRGVWGNLGRVAGEMAHLDRIWDFDDTGASPGRMGDDDACREAENVARIHRVRDDGKPALIFAAHLANWELAAVAARAFGLDTVVVFRAPNSRAAADAIIRMRSRSMGTLIPTGAGAPMRIARELEKGRHVAMLVDQFDQHGVEVRFFGRPCLANPMLARLARHFDCPIHGVRVVRSPNGRYRVELTEAIEPARIPGGAIDVQGTMQIVTSVVERWIREYPDQWLWLHRRWRGAKARVAHPGVTRDDVTRAYAAILGRAPESEKVIHLHLVHSDPLALARTLLSSPEFEWRWLREQPPDRQPSPPPTADDVIAGYRLRLERPSGSEGALGERTGRGDMWDLFREVLTTGAFKR